MEWVWVMRFVTVLLCKIIFRELESPTHLFYLMLPQIKEEEGALLWFCLFSSSWIVQKLYLIMISDQRNSISLGVMETISTALRVCMKAWWECATSKSRSCWLPACWGWAELEILCSRWSHLVAGILPLSNEDRPRKKFEVWLFSSELAT